MTRQISALLAISILLATGTLNGAAAQEAPPPKVVVSAAFTDEITDSARFIGRVEAIDKIDLIARVNGYIEEVAVADGATVTKGDLLYRIEPDAYEAAVAVREADRARASAELDLATVEYTRRIELVERGTISESEADIAEANRLVAEANLKAAEAALAQAELDLSYTEIRAPFHGRIGRAVASIGALVGPSGAPLATLVSQAPIRVAFSINERQLISFLEAADTDLEGLQQSDATPDVFVVLPNGTELDEIGRIAFVGNRIDPATGTLSIGAEFENARRLLLDGAFVNIRIAAQEPTEVVMIPRAAVQRDQRGDFVLVVSDQGRVEQRYVTLGPQVETSIVVEDGMRAGEAVITEGLQRVRPGVAVDAVLAGQPGE